MSIFFSNMKAIKPTYLRPFIIQKGQLRQLLESSVISLVCYKMSSDLDTSLLDPKIQNQIMAYKFLRSTIKIIGGTALFFLLAFQSLQRISYYLTVPTYISSRYIFISIPKQKFLDFQGFKLYFLESKIQLSILFSSVVKQSEATFPTFTLCSDPTIAYKPDALSKHGLITKVVFSWDL